MPERVREHGLVAEHAAVNEQSLRVLSCLELERGSGIEHQGTTLATRDGFAELPGVDLHANGGALAGLECGLSRKVEPIEAQLAVR